MSLLCEQRGSVAILTLSRPEAVLVMTDDRAERHQARRERRTPAFKGR